MLPRMMHNETADPPGDFQTTVPAASMTRGEQTLIPVPSEVSMPDPPSTQWGEGRIVLRVVRPDGTRRSVAIDRPFAMLGRHPASDVRLSHPRVSQRHAYLHLDRRGVFAVDLATRDGTRFDDLPSGIRAAWLRPGRALEIAGDRVELVEGTFEPASGDLGPIGPDPLAATDGLVPLELVPDDPDAPTLRPRSALTFLGKSRSCALRFHGEAVARVHGVLVRTSTEAFLVDLVREPGASGRASAIRPGDRLEIGRLGFSARIRSPNLGPSARFSRALVAATVQRLAPSASPELRDALAGRMFETLRTGQTLLLRSQDQLQRSLLDAARTLAADRDAGLDRHRDRLDRLRSELRDVRLELRGRLEARDAPAPALPLELATLPDGRSDAPALPFGQATAWLLDRVDELERADGRRDRGLPGRAVPR